MMWPSAPGTFPAAEWRKDGPGAPSVQPGRYAVGASDHPGDVADPMSGFFLIKRDVFWAAVRSLSGRGFKILLDLLASAPAGLG